jgi:hypothetical protein
MTMPSTRRWNSYPSPRDRPQHDQPDRGCHEAGREAEDETEGTHRLGEDDEEGHDGGEAPVLTERFDGRGDAVAAEPSHELLQSVRDDDDAHPR